MTFKLTVAQPDTWRVVSEGAGTSRDADGRARWASTDPVDQIHIVGGPLQLTTQAAGAVEAQVYLREADAALSSKYLAATGPYLAMYRGCSAPTRTRSSRSSRTSGRPATACRRSRCSGRR